ncbi:MAG: DUF6607 family protein [Bacteroidota bacterium]
MRNIILIALSAFFAMNIMNAQSKKEKDVAAIKKMCGCYDIEFNFAETFSYSEEIDYEPSRTKRTGGTEWIQLIEGSDDDKLMLQHLLVVGKGDEKFVIKHWREDWLYENRDLYMFNGDNNWLYEKKSKDGVAGQWTQKVFQVDDSPRYEGTATWVHVDGRSLWMNTTDAPLPRREYTQRKDYNVSVRGNHIEITKEGWIHDQDNLKVMRKAGEDDFIVAEEKGLNIYKKVDDSKCQAAIDWWGANKNMWADVRQSWDKVFAKDKDLSLKDKVEDKRLYEYLFSLDPATKPKEIKEIITSFVK